MGRIGQRERTAGQATAEYVAVVLVVGVVLGGAAALALRAEGVAERVVAAMRTGICMAGGDICRTAEAAAAGLQPCLTSERGERRGTTMDVAVLRFGRAGEWQLAVQSDGGAVVTRVDDAKLGGTAGLGFEVTAPGLGTGIEAGVSTSVVATFRGGRAWRFPDARAAGAFLSGAIRDEAVHRSRPPDVYWMADGGEAGAGIGASLADLAGAGVHASIDRARGLRVEGGRRTVTLDLGLTPPYLAAYLPGFPARSGSRRSVVAEVTLEGREPRELVLRTGSAADGRVDEAAARVDLSDVRSRALAQRVLREEATVEDLRALAEHAAAEGVVERAAYEVSERRRGVGFVGKIGFSFGVEHERVTSERRLVDAVARVRGGPPQRRFDCLGA